MSGGVPPLKGLIGHLVGWRTDNSRRVPVIADPRDALPDGSYIGLTMTDANFEPCRYPIGSYPDFWAMAAGTTRQVPRELAVAIVNLAGGVYA